MFAVLAVCWFGIDGGLFPPDFGGTDIYYFKEAGINFAEGLGLTTRFSYGNPTFAYRDYAHYPPIYPLLFGLFVKAAGVSAKSNQAFNSLVAVLAAFVGFVALQPMVRAAAGARPRPWLEGAVALGCVVSGFYGFSYDRPDGLAAAFGVLALLLGIRGRSVWSALAGGALCALAAFTSPFAGIWTALGAGIGVVAAAPQVRSAWYRALWVALGGAVTAALALLVLRLTLPGWFDGFLGVATGAQTHNETGGGYFLALLRGDVRTWLSGFAYSGPESCLPLAKLGAAAAALLGAMVAACRRPGGARRALTLAPLLAAGALGLIIAPYQSNYLTITAALLLAAWAGIEARRPAGVDSVAAIALLCAFGANVLMSAPFEARTLLVRANSGASMQRALGYLETHRAEIEATGGYAAVAPSSYILWRQAGLHPLIEIYSGFREPANRSHVTLLALSFPGSGNLMQPQPAALIPQDDYRLVFQPVLPQPATLLGHIISRSSQTWESAIYARRARP